MNGFSLYSPQARTHSEDDFREMVDQVQILQGKLTAKTEALLRVGKDLEEAGSERKAWKEEKENYESNLKRIEKELAKSQQTIDRLKSSHAAEKSELEARIAKAELRLKSTDSDSSHLRAEIRELQKDCKIYRQKLAKVEVLRMASEDGGDVFSPGPSEGGRVTSSSRETRGSLQEQRLEDFEKLNHEHRQLEADFQTLLTLKEESIQEKDIMAKKIDRLQTELSYLLNGDTRRIADDLDDVLAENRFLKAQLNSAQEESDSMKATLSKYRKMAEDSDNKRMKARDRKPSEEDGLGDKSSVAVINMKQSTVVGVLYIDLITSVREMVSSHSIDLDESDYRAITTILLDSCNDKQMALAHQRKTNKILGARLAEVESKLQKMESNRSPGRSNPFLLSPLSPQRDEPSPDQP
ncbi:hypothetical protein PMAYCL1PPCAC_24400 [Pristionchus mayeri]|uniref:Uncharacterized protein n=1 Tax=Pristionchus mayeri TaxID=1317129 RepID=A0AAN5D1P1_9BILA|nr:hypothetical protein PMAYCL1PPCAC_24400 [Pristionchus mayeri]